jgi:phosphatidylglycerol:prolipoprotein diacylglycerol transferase
MNKGSVALPFFLHCSKIPIEDFDMHNDWFKIGSLTIHGYGVMIAIGVLFGFYFAEKNARKHDLDYKNIDNLIFFVIIIGYIFAKVLYCIVEYKQFLKDPLSVLGGGGWVVYGGILGGIFACWLYCRNHQYDFPKYFNTLIPSVAIAQAFGRIGCYFAGCCYGRATTAWYGVTFPTNSLCPVGTPVIPTQLISSFGDLCIFLFLMYNLNKGKHPEDTFGWYLILYSLGRFTIEFFRGDPRGTVGLFTTSQFISIFLFIGGAYLIYRRQKKAEITEI